MASVETEKLKRLILRASKNQKHTKDKADEKIFYMGKGFLSESGEASSKRLVGVISAIALSYTLIRNQNEPLVYSVAALSAAALGITAAEKIFKKPTQKNEDQS